MRSLSLSIPWKLWHILYKNILNTLHADDPETFWNIIHQLVLLLEWGLLFWSWIYTVLFITWYWIFYKVVVMWSIFGLSRRKPKYYLTFWSHAIGVKMSANDWQQREWPFYFSKCVGKSWYSEGTSVVTNTDVKWDYPVKFVFLCPVVNER